MTEFFLLSTVSLFAIINPFSTVPAFLAITPDDTRQERIRMARMGCVIAAVVMAVFAVVGQPLFSLLGITLPALQIAGGIILFAIGFEMVRAPDLPVRLNSEEKNHAREKEDIAITPLAVPLLCGPGGISTVLVLQTQANSWLETLVLVTSVPVVYFGCYLILHFSVQGASWLNPIILRVLRRIMGLLFSIIAAQFCINGIQAL